ncbi:hypothetical protein C5C18_04935 [Rathayibacter tritici]|nr:hypothetical protein C5C06_05430 [Rathayibacter tritici]PPF69449.1 hypothetical protein C5C21_02840 [Rathayibacter tritici]PPG08341.1 hypothetical protein C5C18_04935 [Rathayibacter tritici]PPI14701.1 hypothetical protein C5D07_08395 [Rathayibacter tritici]PPI43741.1 hypothetical protein C5D18_08600 [Rathayibacter tritici]
MLEGAQRVVVLAATSSPVPTPGPDFNEDTVTPGLFGFVTMLVIALAAVLLALDMARRVRRTTYTAQVKERLDAEEAERRDG